MNTLKNTLKSASENIAFYVNMDFNKLAEDINNSTLPHSFNSKGRKVTYLEDDQEATYLSYSSDAAGKDELTPPFALKSGDTVTCKLQPKNCDKIEAKKLKYKWKDILQSRFDLQLDSKSSSKTQISYNAVATTGESEDDTVIINIHFTLNNVKFSVAWDPRVRVKV